MVKDGKSVRIGRKKLFRIISDRSCASNNIREFLVPDGLAVWICASLELIEPNRYAYYCLLGYDAM
jgi:hypothetical protein